MPFTLGRSPALDGLRALSVLAVMVFHASARPKGEWIGVQVFFVISGLVITLTILEEVRATNGFSLRKFYARRALRLLPALAAMLIVVGAYALLVPDRLSPHAVGRAGLGALFYVANWLFVIKGSRPLLLVHTWSLAVEEQFYLLWPPLVYVLVFRRRGVWAVLIASVVGTIASAAWRYGLVTHHSGVNRAYLGTDTRVDAILVGCALAVVLHAGWMPTGERSLALVRAAGAAGAAVLVVSALTVSRQRMWLYKGGLTALALCAVAVIALVVLSPDGVTSRVLGWRPLENLGRISYGVYLWHLPIFVVTRNAFPHASNAIVIPAMSVLAIGAAALSYRFVEQPFLRLKERFRAIPAEVKVAV